MGPVVGAALPIFTTSSGGAGGAAGAAAVGAWAHARRVPFYCVRAVTDLAGEGFAIDFERARRADGSLPASRILWAALAKRSMGLRELARLGWRSRRASARLGEYLAGCQF